MYNYGGSFGSNCGCGCNSAPAFTPYYPCGGNGCGCGNNSNYAIVLVLFILLVIVIGARYTR